MLLALQMKLHLFHLLVVVNVKVLLLLVGLTTLRGQEEEQPPITPNVRPNSGKRSATTSPKGKKK
jgi:hypothetical protein